MNREKRIEFFHNIKQYAGNRSRRLRFDLHPSFERRRDLREDVALLKQQKFQTNQVTESEVHCEGDDGGLEKKYTFNEQDFWEFLYSTRWDAYSSLRICEGALQSRLAEQLHQLCHHGHLVTHQVAGFDELEKSEWGGILKGLERKEKHPIRLPVKFTFTYYASNIDALQQAVSADDARSHRSAVSSLAASYVKLDDNDSSIMSYYNSCPSLQTRSVQASYLSASGDSSSVTEASEQSLITDRKRDSFCNLMPSDICQTDIKSSVECSKSSKGKRQSTNTRIAEYDVEKKLTVSSIKSDKGSDQNISDEKWDPRKVKALPMPPVGHLAIPACRRLDLKPSVNLVATLRKPLFMAHIPSVESMTDKLSAIDVSHLHDPNHWSIVAFPPDDDTDSEPETELELLIRDLSIDDKPVMTDPRQHVVNTPAGAPGYLLPPRKTGKITSQLKSSLNYPKSCGLLDKASSSNHQVNSSVSTATQSMHKRQESEILTHCGSGIYENNGAQSNGLVCPLLLLNAIPDVKNKLPSLPEQYKARTLRPLKDQKYHPSQWSSPSKRVSVGEDIKIIDMKYDKTVVPNLQNTESGSVSAQSTDSDPQRPESVHLDTNRLNMSYSIDRMRTLKRKKQRERQVARGCHRNRWKKSTVATWLSSKYEKLIKELALEKDDRIVKLFHDVDETPGRKSTLPVLIQDHSNMEDLFKKRTVPDNFNQMCLRLVEDFTVRKEQITLAKSWKTVTTFTINRNQV